MSNNRRKLMSGGGFKPKSYLCFSANSSHTLALTNNGGNTPVLYYSYDNLNYTLWDYSAKAFGTSEHPDIYICGENLEGFSSSESKYSRFSITNSTKDVSVTGNVMALIDMNNPKLKTIPCDYCFYCLFYRCYPIKSIDGGLLPATTLSSHCYKEMFEATRFAKLPEGLLPATTLAECCYLYMFGGSSLTSVPEGLLPATTLAYGCYSSMFYNCHSLTNAPELPATELAPRCYEHMFVSCNLTTAPALPATTLADRCYQNMFEGSNLTTAPALPATTLTDYCYSCMFKDCDRLITAPALPATTLADRCYQYMFFYCSRLNSIKCLAENLSANACLYFWVVNLPASGTFTKKAGVTWPSGNDGIPTGWTVIEES